MLDSEGTVHSYLSSSPNSIIVYLSYLQEASLTHHLSPSSLSFLTINLLGALCKVLGVPAGEGSPCPHGAPG